MQVFKTKWLARFARQEGITDASLREAIQRAEQGIVDADLGDGLIKQRVARRGQGRSGGYRMIVGYRWRDRAVFLFGFAKNDRDNLNAKELHSLRVHAAVWLNNDAAKIEKHLMMGLYRRSSMAKKPNRVVEAILEMADDQLRLGMIDKAEHDKTTMRHLGARAPQMVEPIAGAEIRTLREEANVSQAVFARYLNLTTGFVSQLERGTKQPKGPALVLLNLIRHKGLEAIL